MCCGKEIVAYIPKGWNYKAIIVNCGNTSHTGYPWQCDKCAELNKHRDWKQEALKAGETWEEDSGLEN